MAAPRLRGEITVSGQHRIEAELRKERIEVEGDVAGEDVGASTNHALEEERG